MHSFVLLKLININLINPHICWRNFLSRNAKKNGSFCCLCMNFCCISVFCNSNNYCKLNLFGLHRNIRVIWILIDDTTYRQIQTPFIGRTDNQNKTLNHTYWPQTNCRWSCHSGLCSKSATKIILLCLMCLIQSKHLQISITFCTAYSSFSLDLQSNGCM